MLQQPFRPSHRAVQRPQNRRAVARPAWVRESLQSKCSSQGCIPFLIGALLITGAYAPYFGRTISFAGVHIRLLALMFGMAGVLLAAWYFGLRHLERIGVTAAGVICLLILAFATETQFRNALVQAYFDSDYASFKLARFLQQGLPLLLMGCAASTGRSHPSFKKGFLWAVISMGVGALLFLLTHRDYFFGASRETILDFKSSETASYISLSMLLTSAFVATVCLVAQSTWLRLGQGFAAALLLAGIVVLRQRVHLLVATVVLVLLLAGKRKSQVFAIALVIIGFVVLQWSALFSEAVTQYWEAFFSGQSFAKRQELFWPALQRSLLQPFGHGLASYAELRLEAQFPHNLFVEAFYELGFMGAVAIASITALALYKTTPLFRTALAADPHGSAIRSILFLHLAHSLKASELTSSGAMFMFIYLCAEWPQSATTSPCASDPKTIRRLGPRRYWRQPHGNTPSPVDPATAMVSRPAFRACRTSS